MMRSVVHRHRAERFSSTSRSIPLDQIRGFGASIVSTPTRWDTSGLPLRSRGALVSRAQMIPGRIRCRRPGRSRGQRAYSPSSGGNATTSYRGFGDTRAGVRRATVADRSCPALRKSRSDVKRWIAGWRDQRTPHCLRHRSHFTHGSPLGLARCHSLCFADDNGVAIRFAWHQRDAPLRQRRNPWAASNAGRPASAVGRLGCASCRSITRGDDARTLTARVAYTYGVVVSE